MAEEENNPGGGDGDGNPGYIDPQLCKAYRKTLTTEIKGMEETFTAKIEGLRSTIVVAVSISTAVISIIMWLLSIGGG